jgi:hypothetical protein
MVLFDSLSFFRVLVMSSTDVEKEGYLKKKGRINRKFQERRFILTSYYLKYYEFQKFKGEIDLRGFFFFGILFVCLCFRPSERQRGSERPLWLIALKTIFSRKSSASRGPP